MFDMVLKAPLDFKQDFLINFLLWKCKLASDSIFAKGFLGISMFIYSLTT